MVQEEVWVVVEAGEEEVEVEVVVLAVVQVMVEVSELVEE